MPATRCRARLKRPSETAVPMTRLICRKRTMVEVGREELQMHGLVLVEG